MTNETEQLKQRVHDLTWAMRALMVRGEALRNEPTNAEIEAWVHIRDAARNLLEEEDD